MDEPQSLKKALHQFLALSLQQPTEHVDPMVQPTFGWNVEDRPAGAGFRISRAEHQPRNARQNNRAGTHRTGLDRDVESRAR